MLNGNKNVQNLAILFLIFSDEFLFVSLPLKKEYAKDYSHKTRDRC